MKLIRPFLTLLALVVACFAFSAPAHAGQPNFTTSVLSVNQTTTFLGDAIAYTIKLDNSTGTADANDVWLTNNSNPGLLYTAGTLDGVGLSLSLLSDDIYIGTVPAGGSRTATFLALVASIPRYPRPAQFDNQASWRYSYQSEPGAPLTNAIYTSNSVTTRMVRLEPSVIVTSRPAGLLGTELTYTVTIPNTGTLNSSGSILTTLIPVGGLYVNGSTRLNGNPVSDITLLMPYTLGAQINSLGEPAGQINISEAAVVSFKVTALLGINVGIFTIDPDGVGPAPPINVQGTPNMPQTDLAVTKTDNKTSISPGSTTTYTVRVTNNGPTTVTSLNLWEGLPPALRGVLFTPSTGTYDAGSGDWTGLNLTSGSSITLTVSGKVSALALGTLTNSVTVTAPPEVVDSNPANNSATDSTTLTGIADLAVTQSNGVSELGRGDNTSYTVTVTNLGPTAVSSLRLTSAFTPGVQDTAFVPSQGSYNSTSGDWTGLNLLPNDTITLQVNTTISMTALAPITHTVTVTAPSGVLDPLVTNNVAIDTDSVVLRASLSGTIYIDANHSGVKENGESGATLGGLYVKLLPGAGGNALRAAAVDVTTGAYMLPNVLPGTYSLILDTNPTLTDIIPGGPNGYVPTSPISWRRDNLLVAVVDIPNQDFGLWRGSTITGQVWNDNGIGGGIANDGLRNGAEAGRPGISVTVSASGAPVDTAVTKGAGAYSLWIPQTAPIMVQVIQAAVPGWVAIGGSVSGGTYNRDTRTLSLTISPGTSVTDANFAEVPVNTLSTNNPVSAEAGGTVFIPHTFTAGTAGQVAFGSSQNPSPALSGWSHVVYLDSNGNGVLNEGETPITSPLNLQTGEKVMLLIKAFVPATAPAGARNEILLAADFEYAGTSSPVRSTLEVRDGVVASSQPGLELVQSVDKAQARDGDVLTYTVTYRNSTGQAINNMTIRSFTPAYTNFVGASYAALPTGLTDCTITPVEVGSKGTILWQFSGSLPPATSGSVSFRVRVE